VNVLYMIMDSLPQHLDGATLKKMEGLLLDSRYIAVKVEGKGEAVALDEDVINQYDGHKSDHRLTDCEWEHDFEEELRAVTSEKTMELLKEKNITVGNFADLVGENG